MTTPSSVTVAKPDTTPVVRVEAYLADFIDHRPMPANLTEAVRYGVLGGGKRLRPLLCLRSCESVGADETKAYAPAAAIELIHCFSLVHDDLPAMDDDDLRRGRPTLHKHTSEAMAILAGDGMTSLAFELLSQRVDPPALANRLVSELATATTDMIAGQVYDTLPDFPAAMSDRDRLRIIHRNKTGALIRCACRMGALAGGATAAQLEAITDYADAVGLMFQVVDDLLDVTSTTEELGKAAGKDADKGKLTYPGVMGVEASREQVRRLQGEAHAALDRLKAAGAGCSSCDKAKPPVTGGAALRVLCDYMAVRSR